MDNSTVIVVDARSREQEVSFASATQLPERNGIVLREALKVGNIKTLHDQTLEHPLIVVGSYQAQTSAGFTCSLWDGKANVYPTLLLGFLGEGKSLRPIAPEEAVVIPAGTSIRKVEVSQNSNPATARAAFQGLRLMVENDPNLFILSEGQSDYTSAFAFHMPEYSELPEFPEEHRAADIFSRERIFEVAIRHAARGRWKLPLAYPVLLAGLNSGHKMNFLADIPQKSSVQEIFSESEIRELTEKKYRELIAEGWKFGFDMSVGNHFTRAVSPEGEVIEGNSLFYSQGVEQSFLELNNLNSEEEKEKIRK